MFNNRTEYNEWRKDMRALALRQHAAGDSDKAHRTLREIKQGTREWLWLLDAGMMDGEN